MSRDMQFRIVLVLSVAFMIFIAPKTPVTLQAALVFLTFGVGDLASTKYFLARGYREWNPLARYFLKHWGFSALIITKAIAIIIFLVLIPVKAWPLMAIVGIMVTLQNYWSTQDSVYTSLKVE